MAYTVVRTDRAGKILSIGVAMSSGALAGLPRATGAISMVPHLLPMPSHGPRTVIDHVELDWEPLGHPPPHIYDVPHFDFHFYLVSRAAVAKVHFKSAADSALADQRPPAALLPAGYIMPPGTAVSGMGVHAVDAAGPEFHGQPFSSTFIYGYYDRRLTFLEPMVSLAYLRSKPRFSAPVTRPAAYSIAGDYPSAYSVTYDATHRRYVVTLEALAMGSTMGR